MPILTTSLAVVGGIASVATLHQFFKSRLHDHKLDMIFAYIQKLSVKMDDIDTKITCMPDVHSIRPNHIARREWINDNALQTVRHCTVPVAVMSATVSSNNSISDGVSPVTVFRKSAIVHRTMPGGTGVQSYLRVVTHAGETIDIATNRKRADGTYRAFIHTADKASRDVFELASAPEVNKAAQELLHRHAAHASKDSAMCATG